METHLTNKNKSVLINAIEKLGMHDHLCLIYETQEEQFAAVIPFIRIGLERGEKCVYIVDDNTAVAVLEAMRADGIDIDSVSFSTHRILFSFQLAILKKQHRNKKSTFREQIESTRFISTTARWMGFETPYKQM